MENILSQIYFAAAGMGMPAGPRNVSIVGCVIAAVIALKIARGIIRIISFLLFLAVAAGILFGTAGV